MTRWLPAADDAAGWRGLLLALVAASMVVYCAEAFLQPMTLAWDGWAIEDDARQFLAWTARLARPGAMPGDLIADYWHSVSPPLYRLPFALLAALGVPPPLVARLSPLLIAPLTALAAFSLARALVGRASVAFLAAAAVMAATLHDASIFSATPRALSVPLTLWFLSALARDRAIGIAASLFIGALVYPAPAITGLAMLVLSRLRPGGVPIIDRSRRSVLLVAGTVLLVAIAGISFREDVARWKPALRIADVAAVPAVSDPGARSGIRQKKDGTLGLLVSQRMGFVPEIVHNRARFLGLGGVVDLALFVPLLVAGWRGWRRPADDPRRLYAIAIAAALVCWTGALVFAFRLHLPGRFSQRMLTPLEMIALAEMLAGCCRHRVVAAATAALLAVALLTPQPRMIRPVDRGAVAWIARLPADARLIGVGADLDLVPALTGRAVAATVEHAIPYQLGYYRPLHAALVDSVAVARTPDPATLAAILRRRRATVLAVEPGIAATGELPRRYVEALPELPRTAAGRPAIAAAPAACLRHAGPALRLYDAACLIRWGTPHAG